MVSGIDSAMSVQSLFKSELMNMSSSVQSSSQASDSASYSAISDSLQSTDEAQSASASSSSSSGGSSASSSSEMDLNGDGKVTVDEMIQYLQRQMLTELAEGLEEESDNNDDSKNGSDVIETIKAQQSANAYSKVESVSGSLDLQL